MRNSADIELAAIEAIENAIKKGHIDIRSQQAESIVERLYIALSQYEEENNELRGKLHWAELEIVTLKAENEMLRFDAQQRVRTDIQR